MNRVENEVAFGLENIGVPPAEIWPRVHRALADVRESIRELEYYRRTLFVPLPGPDVETAKAIAAEL